MVYTLTLNPALDYSMVAENIKVGITNRSESEEISFGGKGINVSYVLSQLGIKNTALGFIAGFTGDFLEKELEKSGINTDFIRLKKGFTRINVKLKGKAETEINAKGPDITDSEIEKLFEKLTKIKPGDTLVLSGSVPKSLPDSIYEQIILKLSDKKIRLVVDATGKLLLNTLKFNPFLIKPNIFELEEIFGKKISTDRDIEESAFKLKSMGAVNVIVSLGSKGALLVDESSDIHRQSAFPVNAVNTVGAGDSMVAGFLAGCDIDYDYALKLGAAAGAATAASNNLATLENIRKIINK